MSAVIDMLFVSKLHHTTTLCVADPLRIDAERRIPILMGDPSLNACID